MCCTHADALQFARVRVEQFHEKRELTRAENRSAVTASLSPLLAAEVAWELNKDWMMGVDFFCEAEKAFLTEVELSMKEAVFVPTEKPPAGHLYVIYKGFCRYMGTARGSGDHFGAADVLLESVYVAKHRARAVSYLHVHLISRDTLFHIVHPL